MLSTDHFFITGPLYQRVGHRITFLNPDHELLHDMQSSGHHILANRTGLSVQCQRHLREAALSRAARCAEQASPLTPWLRSSQPSKSVHGAHRVQDGLPTVSRTVNARRALTKPSTRLADTLRVSPGHTTSNPHLVLAGHEAKLCRLSLITPPCGGGVSLKSGLANPNSLMRATHPPEVGFPGYKVIRGGPAKAHRKDCPSQPEVGVRRRSTYDK